MRKNLPLCQVGKLCDSYPEEDVVLCVSKVLREKNLDERFSAKMRQHFFEQAQIIDNCLLQLSLYQEFCKNN